jgi:uncharacterized protein YbaR (Trm112 family)
MKTKVIDIRKHDPEKVVAYWVSQGGNDNGHGRDKKCCPYVGINPTNHISGWDKLYTNLQELIDLPEEEFKTGDRVMDGVGSKGYFIGTLNGIHYYIADDIPYVCSTQTTNIKHYKEPELFEGWVNSYNDHVWKTKEEALYCSSGGRVFKVREVKDV